MIEKIILSLIANEEIRGQLELMERLRARKIDITQATLSRRLNKMGVRKEHGIYALPRTLPTNKLNGLLKVDVAPPNLIFLKTIPGHGQAVAFQLDTMKEIDPNISEIFKPVIGTIAGDDSILIVVNDSKKLETIKTFIEMEL